MQIQPSLLSSLLSDSAPFLSRAVPEQEIRHVVRSLCQGAPDEQRRTIDRFFTPDAEFVHPFCIAPRFNEGDLVLPGLRRLSSRDALRGIFQWYRMLSPKIVIDIDTACK